MTTNHDLTKREQEIYDLLQKELTYRRIGLAFDISPETVRAHVNRIYTKLDIRQAEEILQEIRRTRKDETIQTWRPWELKRPLRLTGMEDAPDKR